MTRSPVDRRKGTATAEAHRLAKYSGYLPEKGEELQSTVTALSVLALPCTGMGAIQWVHHNEGEACVVRTLGFGYLSASHAVYQSAHRFALDAVPATRYTGKQGAVRWNVVLEFDGLVLAQGGVFV
jgi:hypothetical protein